MSEYTKMQTARTIICELCNDLYPDDPCEPADCDWLRMLEEAAVSVPQWISVKDRLPEDGEHVLIWYEYFRYGSYNRIFKTHEIAYQYGGHWTGASDSLGVDARVFAWMPLPEPPKGENDG